MIIMQAIVGCCECRVYKLPALERQKPQVTAFLPFLRLDFISQLLPALIRLVFLSRSLHSSSSFFLLRYIIIILHFDDDDDGHRFVSDSENKKLTKQERNKIRKEIHESKMPCVKTESGSMVLLYEEEG